ncbi:MAG TPA: preprotein translocase subunit YajC [Actinomycetota bacterium]|nr:preprotein translocase subunit YajC [Actinomycetota bacterium]
MDPGSLLMLVIVMIIFYFVLVRPQKKRAMEHSALLNKLAPGDEVVTIGGLYGFINRVEDDMVYLEVSEGVEIRFSKQSISRRIDDGASEPAADEAVEELESSVEAPEPDSTLPPSP